MRTDTALVCGACPMPMQGPHALSSIRAPEAIRSARAPFRAIILKTCLDPGAMTRLTSGWTVLPFKILVTVMRSLKEEFVQLPMAT